MEAAHEGAPVLSATRLAEGEAIWFQGSLLVVKASAETTGGAFDLFEELIPAGSSPPPHVHTHEDEAFYLLDGRMTFFRGDETIQAGPGSFVLLPRGIVHSFRVEGTEPARTVLVVTPGGLTGFFREAGELARERTLPPPQSPDVARLRRVAEQYGIAIVGRPGSR